MRCFGNRLRLTGLFLMLTTYCTMAASTLAQPDSLNRAIQIYKAGQYRQALIQFQGIAKTAPSNAPVHYYMGLCYQALNQVAQARQQYQWVASYSRDPRLRSMAASGLNNLQKYQANRNYAGHGGVSHSQSLAYGGRGLKKVLEFYTDW